MECTLKISSFMKEHFPKKFQNKCEKNKCFFALPIPQPLTAKRRVVTSFPPPVTPSVTAAPIPPLLLRACAVGSVKGLFFWRVWLSKKIFLFSGVQSRAWAKFDKFYLFWGISRWSKHLPLTSLSCFSCWHFGILTFLTFFDIFLTLSTFVTVSKKLVSSRTTQEKSLRRFSLTNSIILREEINCWPRADFFFDYVKCSSKRVTTITKVPPTSVWRVSLSGGLVYIPHFRPWLLFKI